MQKKSTKTKNKQLRVEGNDLQSMVMEKSEYSPNICAYQNNEVGVWLYQANCIEFMDMLIKKYPEGKFDMIFADPPYFLSNGGISCHAGKMVKVDKGDWDKSKGINVNFKKWMN
ncbi:MAG: hypothetical protein AB7T10_09465 [bacterium]